MTKTLLSLATTPAAWLFLIVAFIAGIVSLYCAYTAANNAWYKYQDYRDNLPAEIAWSIIVINMIQTIGLWVIVWQCVRTALRVVNDGKISIGRVLIILALIIVGFIFYTVKVVQTKDYENGDEAMEEDYYSFRRIRRCLIIAAAVVAIAAPISVFAGDFQIGGKPKVATDEGKDAKKPGNLAITSKPEKQASNGQDNTFAPSNLDSNALIEKWYGKYPDPTGDGTLYRHSFKEYDEARKAQANYKRPVLFKYTDPNNEELTRKEDYEATLHNVTYAGAKAEALVDRYPQIGQQNPKIKELADYHRKAYDESDGTAPDGLQYCLRTNPETGEVIKTDWFKERAAELCELSSKFEYRGVHAWQTEVQWGLPTEFETQEDIPVGLRWLYNASDPNSNSIPNELRYMKKYTAAEEQDSLEAVIWGIKDSNGNDLVYGTGIDNKNFRFYGGEKQATTGTPVTVTETYTPPTTSTPPTDNPGTPPNDPGTPPEEPDEPDPVTPDPTPSQEPAKNKNDDPVNQGNAPVGGGENKPDNTTGNDKTQPKPNRNEGGGGSNVTVPSGGNSNGSGQTTTKPDGGGLDNNKTSGTSSGVTSGHTQDTPQTSTSGEQVTGGTPPSAPASQPTQNTQTTVTTTVTDGNGNSTQTTSNTSELEHDGFVEAE